MTDKLDEFDKAEQHKINSRWAVGWKDRGLGHGDYGIVVEQPEELDEDERENAAAKLFEEYHRVCEEKGKDEGLKFLITAHPYLAPPILIAENITSEKLAQHIVDAHNQTLEPRRPESPYR